MDELHFRTAQRRASARASSRAFSRWFLYCISILRICFIANTSPPERSENECTSSDLRKLRPSFQSREESSRNSPHRERTETGSPGGRPLISGAISPSQPEGLVVCLTSRTMPNAPVPMTCSGNSAGICYRVSSGPQRNRRAFGEGFYV